MKSDGEELEDDKNEKKRKSEDGNDVKFDGKELDVCSNYGKDVTDVKFDGAELEWRQLQYRRSEVQGQVGGLGLMRKVM